MANANEKQETKTDNTSSSSGKKAPKLSDLMVPLARTGNDIPTGTYPGLFTGFGEPFYYTEKFKDKKAEEKLCLRLYYLVRLNNGEIERQSERVTLGRDPKSVNIKSKLYKRLRVISNNDETLMTKDGAFGPNITFASFTNKPLILGLKTVEKGDRVFTNVDTASAPSLPLAYPTSEDAERFKHEAEEAHEHDDDDDGEEAIK